jgi:GTP:adenosylcobinamide-phosphate guanylyltransferase
MDALVLAGGIPQPEDPLYTYSNGDSKALIDVAGKPMIQWVLDALGGSKHVRNVIVVGLSPKSGVTCKKPLHFLSNQGRMLANIVAGVNKLLELDKKTEYVLVVSSDIPALKPEMVDWLVDTCMETKDDLYYGICTREVMEARFPESKRTYTRLKDVELCGADINLTHIRMATEHLDMWESLIGTRKSPMRQAGIIGLGTLWQVLTRSITLDDLVEKVCKRLGIKGRAIIWSHAEACMDVDKPHQLQMLRADLEKQQHQAAARAKRAAKAKSAPAKKTAAVKTAKSKTSLKTNPAPAKTAPVKTSRTKTTAKAKPKKK